MSEESRFREISNRLKYVVLTGYSIFFILLGLVSGKMEEIITGYTQILKEPGVLITDYIVIGGIGASLLNCGLLMLISLAILRLLKINITGVSIAATFLMGGFGLFGKNLFNIWFIIGGVYLYSRVQKDKFSKYVYIALFGTSMAPIVSEIMFNINQPIWVRIILSTIVGVSIGFVLPPLSTYLLRVHQGYNLYNIGFTSGIIGTVLVSLLKSFGLNTGSNMIWSTGNNMFFCIYLFLFFISMLIIGYYLNGKIYTNLKNIFSRQGRLVSDFVLQEGFGATLMNIGLNGMAATGYILLVDGELNGPTIGGILTVTGFGALGKHIKNIFPIFIGVFLGGLTKVWNINDPAILLAGLFGTCLAPISGQFGFKYGVIAGFILSSVVLNVGVLHGGFNLYNTGFAAGIVAAVMLPIIEVFRKEQKT